MSIDSDGKPKCRLGVGFLQVEKSYTDEVQNCEDIKDSFGPEKLAQIENFAVLKKLVLCSL